MKKIIFFCATILFTTAAFSQITETIEPEGIIGGDEAGAEDFPWMCSIVLDISEPGCGASLIREQWVLTAGHCNLSDWGINSEKVLINSLHLDVDGLEAYSELIDIEEFIVHEDYNMISGTGPDIALIRLAEPSTIVPVELAEVGDETYYEHGDPAMTLGWGLTSGGGSGSDVLLLGNCRFFHSDTCQTLYSESADSYYELNAGGNICAGYFEGDDPAGAASGDSGGPLFFEDGDGNYKQVGVVSGGESSITTLEFPGVFTLVPEYIDWINNTIEDYEIAASLKTENKEDLTLTNLANHIRITGLNELNDYRVDVYDMMGNLVNEANLIQGSGHDIETNTFSAGIYMVRVYNKTTGALTIEKFSIN